MADRQTARHTALASPPGGNPSSRKANGDNREVPLLTERKGDLFQSVHLFFFLLCADVTSTASILRKETGGKEGRCAPAAHVAETAPPPAARPSPTPQTAARPRSGRAHRAEGPPAAQGCKGTAPQRAPPPHEVALVISRGFRRSEESDVRRVTEQTAMSCCCTTHTAPAPSTRPVWDGADREGGSRPVLTVTPGASARPCPRAVHATPLRGGGQQRHRAPGPAAHGPRDSG